MNRKSFKLDPEHNTPFEVEKEQNETHALLRIFKARHCKALNLTLINTQDQISKKLPAKNFNQLDLVDYSKFTLAAEFVSEADNSYVEVDVYSGSWEEMILTQVELSFSESPFYISYSEDAKAFTIGAPDNSRVAVQPDTDGGFAVLTTIIHAPGQISEIKAHIVAGTEAIQIIGRLYGRIKGRVNGQGFQERQEENKGRYAENLNRTLSEGFHALNA